MELTTSISVGLLVLLCTLIYAFYRTRKVKHSVFKSLGIPGPEPHWITGNAHQLKENKHEILSGWCKKYGTTFGYFEGPTAILYTANPEILKQVMVKEYSKFYARKLFPVQPEPNSEESHMFLSQGERWKRLRTIINPTFSSSKLKQMSPLVAVKSQVLCSKFRDAATAGKPVDVMRLYQRFTLDVIGEVAFGMEVDSQNNPNEPYLVQCKKMFDNFEKIPSIMIFAMYFPILGKILFAIFSRLMKWIESPEVWVLKNIAHVIELRKQERSGRLDLMQLMLDAEGQVQSSVDLAMTADDQDDAEENNGHISSKPEGIKQKLTTEEIKSQGLLFLIAGYETTSNALAYTSYLLALNQDKLKLVHEEIDLLMGDKEELTYEKIHQMSYLDMCICESLRIFPIGATVVDRRCMEDCVICGISFTEGMTVMANMIDLHMDPELWGPADPEQFEPERFSPEERKSRHPLAWIPFGAGPRNCVGMRFALMEAKIALATLLSDYTFQVCEETEIPLKKRLAATLSPKNGVVLKIVERQHSS